MDGFEIYDALRCSVRYPTVSTEVFDKFEVRDDLVRIEERHPGHTIETVHTPLGELRTVYRDIWEDGARVNHRIEEFPVKTARDLRVLTDLVNRQRFRANRTGYERAEKAAGERGAVTVGFTSSGFTDLIKHHCGLVETFYLLHDHPAEVEAYLEACDRRDDRFLDEALKLPYRIFDLYDHANNEVTPPPILKKYLIPRWQRLAERLHANGRFLAQPLGRELQAAPSISSGDAHGLRRGADARPHGRCHARGDSPGGGG
jgi:hypothetical protein